MIRIVVAMVGVAVAVTTVMAQGEPLAVRKDLMKKANQNAKSLNSMVKGEAPFDAAAVTAAFAHWEDTAAKFPDLFPENSKGGDTRALPKIWETNADFRAKNAAFAKAVADHKGKAGSLDGLKAAMPAINTGCDNCHEQYRGASKKKK